MISEEQISVGNVRSEGGCMNYYRPQLFDSGRKAAIICGKQVKIINVSDGIQDHTFSQHKQKVVGLVLLDGQIYSCDEKGKIFGWHVSQSDITCSVKASISLPGKGVVEHLAHVSAEGRVAVVVRFPSGDRQLLSKYITKGSQGQDVLINSIAPGTSSFSFSREKDFCVGITYQGILSAFEVVPTNRPIQKNKSFLQEQHRKKRILAEKRTFTCVAAHPTQITVAAGDCYGGVEVYYNVLGSQYRSSQRLQLHRLAATDLLFSFSGFELYSCSHQGVLVLWTLRQGSTKQKQNLPQLYMPMTHLSMDPGGAALLATHTDNSFSLVDLVEFKFVNVFVGLGVAMSVREQVSRASPHPFSPAARAAFTSSDGAQLSPDSVILTYDPRTKGVVTKSRPGHLHFYNAETQQQLFLVDVVHENFRMDATTYRDVTRVSFSSDGCVMVTVDSMEDDPLSQQLKFWLFDHQNQRWRMDTSVLCPHSALIQGCELQPQQHLSTASSQLPLCLTYCKEGVLKLWKGCLEDDISQWASVWESQCWDGRKPATCGRWSWCGQVLAVAHEDAVSVWQPQPLQWNFQLSHPRLSEPIIDMCFSSAREGGAVTCLIVCRSTGVTSWCLRSRRHVYTAPIPAVAMAYDADTALIAVSTTTGKIILFRGEEGEPLRMICTSAMEAFKLLFLPLAALPPRLLSTRLYYFSSMKELASVPINMCRRNHVPAVADASATEKKDTKQDSQFSLLLSQHRTVETPVESIFSFRVSDKSSVLPSTFIVEEFEDTCELMSQLSKFVLDFDKKASALSAR